MGQLKLFSDKRGVIFIDAMMGILLLTVLVFSVTATMRVAFLSRTMADQHTKAAILISRELESVRSLGYGNTSYTGLLFYGLIDSSSTQTSMTFTTIGGTGDRINTQLPSGTGSIIITDSSSTVKKVTVTINWAQNGRSHSDSASTLLAKLE